MAHSLGMGLHLFTAEEDWAQHLGPCSAQASSHKLSAPQLCWFKKTDTSQHEGFIERRRRDRKLVFSFICFPQLHALVLCPGKTHFMKEFYRCSCFLEDPIIHVTSNNHEWLAQFPTRSWQQTFPTTTAFLRDQYRWKNCLIKHIPCLIVKWTNKSELGKKKETSFNKCCAQIGSFRRERLQCCFTKFWLVWWFVAPMTYQEAV